MINTSRRLKAFVVAPRLVGAKKPTITRRKECVSLGPKDRARGGGSFWVV